MLSYRLGKVEFTLSGTTPILQNVERQLEHLRSEVIDPHHIRICGEPLGSLHTQVHGWVVAQPGPRELVATPVPPRRWGRMLPTSVHRFVHPAHVTAAEELAALFVSEFLQGWLHWKGLEHKQVLLPGMAVSGPSGAVAVIGAGATGKSGAALRLCMASPPWRFLADDTFFVNRDGVCLGSVGDVVVAQRNVSHPDVQGRRRAVAGRTDLLAWELHARIGSRGLRRHIPPDTLLEPDSRVTNVPLRRIVVIRRAQVAAPISRCADQNAAELVIMKLLKAETRHLWSPRDVRSDPELGEGWARDVVSGVMSANDIELVEALLPAPASEAAAESFIMQVVGKPR